MSARGLVKSASAVTVVTGSALVFGLVRNILTAREFGATRELDAFNVSAVVPNALIYLFGLDILRGVATTLFSGRLADATDENRQRLFASLLNSVIVVSLSSLALASLVLPLAIRLTVPGFSPEARRLTLHLSYVTIPMVAFIGVGAYLAAVLNAYRRFALPATLRMGPHLGAIVFILLTAHIWGVYSIAAGMTVGAALAALLQFWGCLRIGLRWQPVLESGHPELRKAVMLSLPVMTLAVLGQLGTLLQWILGSYLTPGKISALSYSMLLAGLVIRLLSEPLTTVLLPELSQVAASKDRQKLGAYIRRGTLVNAVLMLPASVLLVGLAPDLVKVVYQRGHFGAEAVVLTSSALRYIASGLVFWGMWLLLVRVYIAREETVAMAKNSVGAYLVYYGSSILLVRNMDYLGLALAPALQNLAFALLLWFGLKRRIRELAAPEFRWEICKALVPAAAMAGTVYFATSIAGPVPSHLMAQIARLAVILCASSAVYIGFAGTLFPNAVRVVAGKLKARSEQTAPGSDSAAAAPPPGQASARSQSDLSDPPARS